VDGVSLWRHEVPAERGVYFESYHGYLSYGWSPLAGWADRQGKYIHSPEPELYLPETDRKEGHNELAQHPEAGERYRARMAELAAQPRLPMDDSATSDELLADLAALGYATAAVRAVEVPDPLTPSDLPAPATRVEEYQSFLEAQKLMEERRLKEAVRVLEVIVVDNPRHVSALDKLGLAFVIVQGWDPAIVLLEQRLALAEGSSATYNNLALAYEHTGKLEEALEMLERARELSPSGATSRANMARVLEKLGRTEEARELLEDQAAPSTPLE
jgi:tetratricopeptide (TPR) repeat protein